MKIIEEPKIFCWENSIGVVHNKEFFERRFNKRQFITIIVRLIRTKRFSSADLILKEALKEYLHVTQFRNQYRGKCISDSLFYMKWRNIIKRNRTFIVNAKIVENEKMRQKEVTRYAREKYMLSRTLEFERILRRKGIVVGKY